jgi:hypothetical protein
LKEIKYKLDEVERQSTLLDEELADIERLVRQMRQANRAIFSDASK